MGTSGEVHYYNSFDQLTRRMVIVTSRANTYYTYNAQGIRTAKKTPDGLRTAFLLDGGNVVGEVQNNTVTQNYLRGINLIRREAGTATDYYLFNAHGDVVNLVNTAGVVTQSYDYDAFGVEKDPDPLDTNHFRYCGEYLDAETGRYYLRARYYDPLIGRFAQKDPALDGINWYTYCYNNPLYFIDPSGLVVEILYHDLNEKIYNHIDIAINGIVYSFAAYDTSKLLGSVGPGYILRADKDKYVEARTQAGIKITAYELNVTQDQEDALLSVLEGYLENAKEKDKKTTYSGEFFAGKNEDGLDRYTVIPIPGVGTNCAGFVLKSLSEAQISFDVNAPKPTAVPSSFRHVLQFSYRFHLSARKIAEKFGLKYGVTEGAVVAKTVYEVKS